MTLCSRFGQKPLSARIAGILAVALLNVTTLPAASADEGYAGLGTWRIFTTGMSNVNCVPSPVNVSRFIEYDVTFIDPALKAAGLK